MVKPIFLMVKCLCLMLKPVKPQHAKPIPSALARLPATLWSFEGGGTRPAEIYLRGTANSKCSVITNTHTDFFWGTTHTHIYTHTYEYMYMITYMILYTYANVNTLT